MEGMMRKTAGMFLFVCGIAAAASLAPSLALSNCRIANRFPLPGDDRWDFLLADSATGRLYISHGTQTQVMDERTHHVFTSTAEFGPAPLPSADNPKGRPPVKPGTFIILDIAPAI